MHFQLSALFFFSRAKYLQKVTTEMWQGPKKKTNGKAVLFEVLAVKTVPCNESQEMRNGAWKELDSCYVKTERMTD